MPSVDKLLSLVTGNANWMSTSHMDAVHNAATVKPMGTRLPSAGTTLAVLSLLAPTELENTHAQSQPARRDPPVPTLQFTALIAIHHTRQATRIAQNG